MQCVERKTSSDGVKVFRAIDRDIVLAELRRWAACQREAHPELVRVGLFGSYAKGKHAPGSDLDILLLLTKSPEPVWFMRAKDFDTSGLSVGADLFVYTEAEAARLQDSSAWFSHILSEVLWID